MFDEKKFEELKELDKEITLITHLNAVLEYDMETAISKKGTEERALQMAWVSNKLHSVVSSKTLGDVLKSLGAREDCFEGFGRDDFEKALIRKTYENYRNAVKIPSEFIERKEKALAHAYSNWAKAREENNFLIFRDSFKEVVDLAREEASYIKEDNQSLYDALLNCYEEKMTAEKLDEIFNPLEKSLVEFVDKYKDIKVEDSFLYSKYDEKKQESFALKIIDEMKFDKDRGVLGLALHPFTSTLGVDDIRITTRYDDPSVIDPLSSTVHEAGHALYEMNACSGILKGTCLGEGVSMGFHESQSRFWENIVLRSPVFWKRYYSELKSVFPEQLGDVDVETFVKAINQVRPSYIRCNADEVTYNLHIILRYRIEKDLIEGKLEVDDVPRVWDEYFEKMFKKKVDKLSNGCLQDVHWSGALFGYFPTYALGNLYSAQIYDTMIKDFNGKENFDNKLEKEGVGFISDYLCEKVHSKGCVYSPDKLIKNITGKALDGKYFTEYLTSKLEALYK